MPLLPRLPDLNIDINIPVIQLPKLPDLPPPPKIPELSQAITIVLKIFKLIVLIMCLYRKVPLSPEWFVGTKVAHKTERQGYLPFDFLDYGLPTVSMEWLDAIRVSTHVKLKYDVDYITDALKSALEPFTNFPRNLFRQGTSNSSTVNIDINPDTGVKVETTSDISSLPELIAQLYRPDIAPAVSIKDAEEKLGTMVSSLDIPAARKTQLLSLINTKAPEFSTNGVQEKFEDRFSQIHLALAKDIEENTLVMKDIAAWREGKKKPEEIAFIRQGLPNMPHLAQSEARLSHFLSLTSTVLNPLASLTQNSITPDIASTIAVTPTPDVVAAPGTQNTFSDKAPDVSGLARTR